MGRLCIFIYNLYDFYGKSIGKYAISMNPSWDIWGVPKMVVPNNQWIFPLKMIILGGDWGYHLQLYPPPRIPVTTRIISFLVGNPYKPLFVTVTLVGSSRFTG